MRVTRASAVAAVAGTLLAASGVTTAVAATQPTRSTSVAASTHRAATAATRTVAAKPTLTISAPATVTRRTAFTFTITGVAALGKVRLGGRVVLLQQRLSPKAAWTSVARKTTAARTGVVRFTVTQKASSDRYRLVLLTANGRVDATSRVVTLHRA
ncbi:MAG TPA: hypothetical protein VI248_12085 [Kineosporiaceae bacterium]